MTRKKLITFCLSFPDSYEDYPFGGDSHSDDGAWTMMRHRANKKSFAHIYQRDGRLCINLKCEPIEADFLRQAFSDVTPAYHMNKEHWNTVALGGDVPEKELKRMVGNSYDLIKPKRKTNRGMKMKHEIIDQYLDGILTPQLASFHTPDEYIERVIATVRELMVSCVSHWNDRPFRKAILFTGEEEGTYYLPKASKDIKCFVVVTIRNSAIETIHADSYQPTGKSKRLTGDDIKTITAAAIEYFSKVDFPKAAEMMGTVENNIFSALAEKHPVSWGALTALANSNEQVIDYDYISASSEPTLDNLEPQQAVSGLFFKDGQGGPRDMVKVTADGYSLAIDPGLRHILQVSVKNEIPFVSDSFKAISRNIEKLLTVMEYILGNDIAVITSNYLIANGYIERRLVPLKPGHDLEGITDNMKNGTGLTQNHYNWLKATAGCERETYAPIHCD